MASSVSDKFPGIAPKHSARTLAMLLAIAGLGLALGGCSKCDVPDWFHKGSPQAPRSCNDAPPPQ
jgi:hypothetical protein